MGWSGYYVDPPVDRKHECDLAHTWDDAESSCRVLKSSQRGRVYYAACEYTNKKTGETYVYGCVCLTEVDNKDEYGCNFWIKMMDETVEPFYYDCPIGILNLLSPTNDPSALRWREKCRQKATEGNAKRNALQKLPVGSEICFQFNGSFYNAEKCAPSYQFKHPWWYVRQNGTYIKQTRIPTDFEIVKKGGEIV